MRHLACCTCNNSEKYQKYLRSLLASIARNSPQTCVHIRLVNCPPQREGELKKIHEKIVCQNDSINLPSGFNVNSMGPHEEGGVLYLLSKRRREVWGVYNAEAYYSCMIKYDTISNIIGGSDLIIYLDVDTIIRSSLGLAEEEMRGYDMGMYFNQKNKRFPHAGLIMVKNGAESKNTIEKMKNYFNNKIQSMDLRQMNIDEGDGDLLFEHCENLRIKRLSRKWKDEGPNHKGDSFIWSGRAEAKLTNAKYIEEMNKYYAMSCK